MRKDLQDTFSDADILFVLETVDNRLLDRKDTVKGDPAIVEGMLDHQSEKLYHRIMVESSEGILSGISPRLLFEVLLRETRKELEKQGYTMERSAGQKIPVFDAEQVVRFLTDSTITTYLADMMASFTRIESYPVSRQLIKGVWKEIRFNDMDIDAIIQMCESVEEQYKFGFYKRAADLCVFIPGMFPDRVPSEADLLDIDGELSHYFGASGRTTKDYEEEGALFYKLAAEHREAAELELSEVLWHIRENVGLAKKPLSHISDNLLPSKSKEADLLKGTLQD